MTLERKIAGLFKLDDDNWMRHANPISVWTRYSVLPVIVLAFWSREWIGWWCLLPGLVSLLWLFFNPILFKKPKSTKNWASKAVLGERVFLNRDIVPIPDNHNTLLHAILNGISFLGVLLSILATVYFSVWGAVLGVALAYLGKSWYLDRMVWLYEDMKEKNELYRSWEY
ncbi:DUF6653 family protein [uncultured Methylophaga sp.]|uniref:DUF6653 family protein n=1 Tax=uncultured Methylophaga sp. TaxID=285271 RepID=UPI0030DC821D|tara:strand:- start:582 stop:1091 length:510 start_codon:yes stop_codon:yes gene_type:complete